MQLTFDPQDPTDVALITAFLSMASGAIDAEPATRSDADTDAKGTPWLADHHSPERTLNKDGTWRRRKGVDKDAATRAEMTARGSAPIAIPAAASTQVAPALSLPAAPALSLPVAPALSLPVAPALPLTYDAFLAEIAAVQTAKPGAITGDVWGAWLAAAGIADNAALISDESARRAVLASAQALLAA